MNILVDMISDTYVELYKNPFVCVVFRVLLVSIFFPFAGFFAKCAVFFLWERPILRLLPSRLRKKSVFFAHKETLFFGSYLALEGFWFGKKRKPHSIGGLEKRKKISSC